MKAIIILSGPVGAGKTTTAKELLKIMPGPVAYIEGDTFWRFIVKSIAHNDRFENFKTTMLSAVLAALPYPRNGYDVIVDFSLPPWFLLTVQKIAAKRETPLHYVVINPGLAICKERVANRSERQNTDYAPYQELYNCFDDVQQYTIHDEQGDAATIAQHIWEGLNEGIFLVE